MKNRLDEYQRRSDAREEMREIRTPQTRMSFLTYDRYRRKYDNPPGGKFRQSRDDDETRRMHVGKGPRSYRRSDESIYDDVCRRLEDDPHIDASDIEVSVSGGEVILSGTVDSRTSKRNIDDVIESVRGVAHSENRVRVQSSSDIRTRTRETFK